MAVEQLEGGIESVEIPKYNGRAAVIGSGGREHKLAKQLAESKSTSNVFVLPGNAGTAEEDGIENVELAYNKKEAQETIDAMLDFIEDNDISLVVVGPEDPLADGIVDSFYKREMDKKGLSIFGPSSQAAQLESSKKYTKELCRENNIPTADYEICPNIPTAKGAVNRLTKKYGYPIVLKADGLAAGKGVIIAKDANEAHKTIEGMMREEGADFGDAGKEIVVERCLVGEEVSITAIVDASGEYKVLASSQDHKRVGQGDTGLNTGGMGAYAPADHIMTPEMLEKVKKEIIEPTLKAMKERDTPFSGFLYAGLMITEDEETQEKTPNLIEYNVRFGDPETQVVLPLFPKGVDFAETIHAAANENLASIKGIEETLDTTRYAVTTVLCATGYPTGNDKGYVIDLPDRDQKHIDENNLEIIHAGTGTNTEGKLIGTGGRVMSITSMADSVEEAVAINNHYAQTITDMNKDENGNPNLFYRGDIGWRAIEADKKMQKIVDEENEV